MKRRLSGKRQPTSLLTVGCCVKTYDTAVVSKAYIDRQFSLPREQEVLFIFCENEKVNLT